MVTPAWSGIAAEQLYIVSQHRLRLALADGNQSFREGRAWRSDSYAAAAQSSGLLPRSLGSERLWIDR
tara:strand:- start:676 stop:879 length:204 start_codon:yes stop_codon:yes gene_type:complete